MEILLTGPLVGYRVIEVTGIGPGPYAGQLLADLGAEVICIQRPNAGVLPSSGGVPSIDNRGKKSIVLDLKKPAAITILKKLVATADVLTEGNRPGVMERLGIGPEACHEINPKLIYGRMTGWGQTGPWANKAGHDINYISITGALNAIGKDGEPPMPPVNLVGDYGGGSMVLVMGILSALLQAEKTGHGDVIDAAIIDGVSSLMGIIYTLAGLKQWTPKRESNLLDGGAPFYRCYKTSDEKFMAVGCIEPQFFAIMLDKLEIDSKQFGGQYDPKYRSAQHKQLETIFASKTRDEWSDLFDGTDACITPVLDYVEATQHPQNIARGGLKKHDPYTHPRTVPAFSSRPHEPSFTIANKAGDTKDILAEIGYNAEEIEQFINQKITQ